MPQAPILVHSSLTLLSFSPLPDFAMLSFFNTEDSMQDARGPLDAAATLPGSLAQQQQYLNRLMAESAVEFAGVAEGGS